jgi:hypothetical protein
LVGVDVAASAVPQLCLNSTHYWIARRPTRGLNYVCLALGWVLDLPLSKGASAYVRSGGYRQGTILCINPDTQQISIGDNVVGATCIDLAHPTLPPSRNSTTVHQEISLFHAFTETDVCVQVQNNTCSYTTATLSTRAIFEPVCVPIQKNTSGWNIDGAALYLCLLRKGLETSPRPYNIKLVRDRGQVVEDEDADELCITLPINSYTWKSTRIDQPIVAAASAATSTTTLSLEDSFFIVICIAVAIKLMLLVRSV